MTAMTSLSKLTANRYHDFCAGHRVVGHENKCRNLHGHNYRVHFFVSCDELDAIGRVVDFSVINTLLCQWLETKWDHKMILWEEDPYSTLLVEGVTIVPFNPTAENMAKYLVDEVGPSVLPDYLVLQKVVIEETRKCSVTYERQN